MASRPAALAVLRPGALLAILVAGCGLPALNTPDQGPTDRVAPSDGERADTVEPSDGLDSDERSDGGSDVRPDAGPDSTDDGQSTDTGPDLTADAVGPDGGIGCNLASPFATPGPLENLGDNDRMGDEQGGFLSPDGRVLFFAHNAPLATPDLLVATRLSTGLTFSEAQPLSALNLSGAEGRPVLGADSMLYFDSDREVAKGTGAGDTHLWRARVTLRGNDVPLVSAPERVPGVDGTTSERDAYLSADGRLLYFSRLVNGDYDIFVARRGAPGDPFVVLGALSFTDGANDRRPVVAGDGTLYLARDSGGNFAIHIAHRTSDSDPTLYDAPTRVEELNAPGLDRLPSQLSPDGCLMLLEGFEPGTTGGDTGYKLLAASRGGTD